VDLGVLPPVVSVYDELNDPPPATHVYETIDTDKPKAAGTYDDVTDITLVDNDLYEREGQVQGQQNTSGDYERTLVDND